ncbi:MAG: 16S rRNA (cytidine(1402)-2'-O)-methyltransferase [Desulfobulbaceae bacterium]|nr:16S rRNA (cytidine(1402)-2'-O)-methyltransferase [Desulfobulbaceae bacterium]
MPTTTPDTGTLYVVATPIGNLEEITPRAVRILTEVDLIACEDTRHTRKLINHLQITTPLTSYYREKEQYKAELLLQQLQNGVQIALVSDAGTPCISDPGSVLVRQARGAGIPVVPVSGPSALITAISVAGLEQSGFFFAGFPPSKKKARKDFFKQHAALPCPLIFYESPHRIQTSLLDAMFALGDRQAQLFRELTKVHEEHRQGTLSELSQSCAGKNRGEFVVIVDGAELTAPDKPEDIDELILWYRDQQNVSLKKAVQQIAADLDIPRTKIYQRALTLWKTGPTDPER